MVRDKKGSLLIIAMIFMLTALISSLVLYSSIYNFSKTHGVRETRQVRGTYLAYAGQVYATMLLKNPVTYAGFASDPPLNGASVTKTISSTHSVGADLGLASNETIVVKMVYSTSTGKYTVTSTYSN
ncbi:MAG: hypothetical protein WC522_01455 [Candidatus Omnitrophota bacterium]